MHGEEIEDSGTFPLKNSLSARYFVAMQVGPKTDFVGLRMSLGLINNAIEMAQKDPQPSNYPSQPVPC